MPGPVCLGRWPLTQMTERERPTFGSGCGWAQVRGCPPTTPGVDGVRQLPPRSWDVSPARGTMSRQACEGRGAGCRGCVQS